MVVVVTLVEGLVAVTSENRAVRRSNLRRASNCAPRMINGARSLMRDSGIDPVQAHGLARRQADLRQRAAKKCRGRDNEQLRRLLLIVAEGRAAELRVSGVFKAGDTPAFLEAMESLFPVDGRCVSLTPVLLRLQEAGKNID